MTTGHAIRHLVRAADAATLAVTLEDGSPYAALVLLASDHSAAPLLFISELAEHTKALRRDPRAALLIDGTTPAAPGTARLTGARTTLVGRFDPVDDPLIKARFLARHGEAEFYRDFADFHLWRMTVERAHLVAGFGRIAWVPAAEVLADVSASTALTEAEAGIIAHMNADHRDALTDYAEAFGGQPAGDWQMTGIDPEGLDLQGQNAQGQGCRLRLDFPAPVTDAKSARSALVALARDARHKKGENTVSS